MCKGSSAVGGEGLSFGESYFYNPSVTASILRYAPLQVCVAKHKGENNGGDSYAIADVSADNWEKVIEENFGIKITLPDGWTIQSVASPNGYSNVKIFFVPGGSETYDSFGETLFAACKTASTQKDMEKASFADTAMAKGTCSWKYYPDIKLDDGQTVTYIQINYYDNGSNIEMTIQR